MNILILTDKYYPKPLANAVCVQAVAEFLQSIGHKVIILAYKDVGVINPNNYCNMDIYYIEPDFRLKLYYSANNNPKAKYANLKRTIATILNRSHRAFHFRKFPLYSYRFPKRILNYMECLNEKYQFDIIVSTYCSFENALSGMMYKKRHSDVKWCLYALDTFTLSRIPFMKNKNNYWLPKFLDVADIFLYMRSREKELISKEYDKWRYKMKETDIPLYKPISKTEASCHSGEEKVEHWVYAGALGAPHYLTEDFVEIFSLLKDDIKREMIFYSSGDELNKLKNVEKKTNGKIKGHSYIEHDRLMEVLDSSDVLVSIKYTSQISAKIFEYISMNKVVVHFSGCDDDPNRIYIKNYSKGIVVDVKKYSAEQCAKYILEKLKSINGENLNNYDYKYFEMNKPEYTANLIIQGD